MSRMRVVHLYKDVFSTVPGGIERHIEAIRAALPEIQHDVLVCGRQLRTRCRTFGPSKRYETEVLVGELGRVLSTPIAPTFPRWLRRLGRGAVLHLHMPQPLAEVSVLLQRTGSPLVATYHADIHRQRALYFLYRPLVLRCLRRANAVLVASAALANTSPLLREAGVPLTVVPYGIDVARWAPDNVDPEAIGALRKRYGFPHIVAVGRLRAYKGFDRLIAIAPRIPWQIVIVGDGPMRGALGAQVRRLNAGDKVHLVGDVDDDRLASHLAAASVFVLPSWNRAEAFGISLLEAQAAELPVVATDVGTGTAEAFVPGRTGTLIPPDEPGALVNAVTDLLSDLERSRQMGKAGRRRVETDFSLEALARALEPVYERSAAA